MITSTMRALIGLGFAIALFSFARPAHAALLPYDPSNIIRDDIFLEKGSMNASQIQSFLTEKGSCLATAAPADLGPGNVQTAAQLIAQAASSANGGQGINPQVILTTLQKEWSLISRSCAQLDATYGGHAGAPQAYLKRALGYNVPDVLGVGDCLYSFVAQLLGNTCSGDTYRSGPSSMRNAYDTNKVGPGGTYAWPASYTVQEYSTKPGTITVTPRTKATAVLYRYTPYAYYGNFNFFNIFQTFFRSPICSTNLEVIKSDATGQASVLFEGTRYPISSIEALNAWGLDCIPVTLMGNGGYTSYPVGGTITRVFKEAEGPRVFIAQDGTARHIRTSLYVGTFGLQNEEVGSLPQALIGRMPEGNPLGFLVKAEGRSEIYLAQASRKYYIADIPTIEAWGFPLSELIETNPTYVDSLPTAGNLSTLVKGSGPDIFVATLRSFVYAPSTARLQDWNMQSMGVTLLDDSFLDSLPKTGSLSRITRGSGKDTYYIENKRRYHVTTSSAAANYERLYGKLTPMADSVIAAIPYAGKK